MASLHGAAEGGLGPLVGLELVVLSASDWKRLISYPYGWPLTRRSPEGVSLVVAAEYPNRLVRRWDAVLLKAAKAGVPAPGGVRAFLDALVGLEWGHAALYPAKLRSRAPWLNELLAAALYLAALRSLGDEGRARYLGVWAQVQSKGSVPKRRQLEGFVYPRAKGSFDDLLWVQGTLMRGAARLEAAHGWAGLRALQGRLGGSEADAALELGQLEPRLSAWLALTEETENERELEESAEQAADS